MSSLKRKLTSSKTKWIITFVLLFVLALGLIGVGVKLNKTVKTKTIPTSAYAIGTLDATGKFSENTSSIYTENYINVDGLKCELVTNPTITYKVFYYDTDKVFVSATSALNTDLATPVPETAKYCRIMITPTADAEVGLLEVHKYASQLTVTINK